MKKLFSVLLFGTILSVAIVSNVSAQLFASSLTLSSRTALSSEASTGKGEASISGSSETKADYKATKAAMKANKANLRATTNFEKNFKNAPAAKWFAEEKIIGARFSEDDVTTRVIYDKKGRWLHTMSTYHQEKLSSNVAKLVRSVYPGYDITAVQDIKEGLIQFYVIHLENKHSYKQVCVYEGEVNTIKEFDKD